MNLPAPIKDQFQLDPSIHFLNHGSFGACPRSVFDTYQAWQKKLEFQPVLFLGREMIMYDKQARKVLAEYLQTSVENLVFIPNATYGVNVIARSISLSAGDEILTSDHEYGACDFTWEFVCQKSGAVYIHQPVAMPAKSKDEILDQFWMGVTDRTKVIFISHITSPTALEMPVREICQRAHAAGILTVVDGAHAPGQIDINLSSLEVDWYIGNCHKWMLSPKGAGFLYSHPRVQNLVEPLIVSWGFHAQPNNSAGTKFQDYLGWTGTKDPAASLTVPSAIQFMRNNNWEQYRLASCQLLRETIVRICDLVDIKPMLPITSNLFHQMGIAPLPDFVDLVQLKERLYSEYRVEVPLIFWNEKKFIRISIQGYNTQDDTDALIVGLKVLIPLVRQS